MPIGGNFNAGPRSSSPLQLQVEGTTSVTPLTSCNRRCTECTPTNSYGPRRWVRSGQAFPQASGTTTLHPNRLFHLHHQDLWVMAYMVALGRTPVNASVFICL